MQFAFGKFDFNNSRQPPKAIEKICNIATRNINGRKAFILSPKEVKSERHILYLHGGAYVQNFVNQHWKFLSLLVRSTGCTITAPDYPLAPKHTYIDSFGMVIQLYRQIIDDAGAGNVIVMGDSAGGGFALALCQNLLIEKIAQPKRIVLLSPWLDVTLKNPEIAAIDRQDPFLGISGLRKAALAYAGNTDLNSFMLSPINGPLAGLGEISLFIGTKDILVADARKLLVLAKENGVAIDYHEYEDMVHVWMLLYFRESRKAQDEIKHLITNI